MRPTELAFLLLLVPALLVSSHASAQIARPGEVVLEDQISVEVLGRELIAFDLQGSGQLVQRLELDEEVIHTAARGRVALVLTNRRVLGATPHSASWQSERYRLTETPQTEAWISQSLAVVVTEKRALAFFGTGNWAEQGLRPREQVEIVRVGPATAVVVTDRRALGISTGTGGFFETPLRVKERVESVQTLSEIATLTTSQRTLVFKGPSGLWVERSRPLR